MRYENDGKCHHDGPQGIDELTQHQKQRTQNSLCSDEPQEYRRYVVSSRDISVLQPRAVDMIRVGRDNDGGYVIPAAFLNDARMLISLGVSDDWSFEIDFTNRTAQRCAVVLCDRSAGTWTSLINAIRTLQHLGSLRWKSPVTSWRWLKNGVRFLVQVRRRGWRFYRRWVVATSSQSHREVGLQLLLQRHLIESATVLKIDIEGAEYGILEDLCRWSQASPRPIGLIVEFHGLHTRFDEVQKLVNKLGAWYEVVHLHGNNYGAVSDGVPDVVEVVFALAPVQGSLKRTSLPLAGFDQPNNPLVSEIQFRW